MRPFLLASLVLTWSAGGSLAQICGTTSATPLRVDTLAGVGALLGAVNCTDGGTVEAVWAGAITLDEPISVGSGTFLSIAGEDALAEVQGGSQVRLFDVSPSGGLALAQLKLSGGTAESGGAIFSSAASVSIYGCLFEGNVASNGDGGAVSAKGGELTIVGGEFVGNSATRNGGAVWASEAGLVVREGTRFERNTAAEGGGLFCDVAENATEVASGAAPSCSFSDVVFAFNSATLSGGAIYGGQDSFMAIDDCTFENNTTPGNGGAVVAASATLGGDTLVTNNVAEGSGGGVRLCFVHFSTTFVRELFVSIHLSPSGRTTLRVLRTCLKLEAGREMERPLSLRSYDTATNVSIAPFSPIWFTQLLHASEEAVCSCNKDLLVGDTNRATFCWIEWGDFDGAGESRTGYCADMHHEGWLSGR